MKHLIQKIREFVPELPGQSDHCATSVVRVPHFFKYPDVLKLCDAADRGAV